MKNHSATRFLVKENCKFWIALLAAALVLSCVSPAVAQQKDKKKKPVAESDKVRLPLTDPQQIDYMLSEMLAAWQLGQVEKLHAKYSDDVSLVNGSWAPPVVGWTNYLAIYEQQRAHMQQVNMERSNTYIKVDGNMGWACYQWDFTAVVDGKPLQSQGHTTVVVEKRNDRWIIVHNHTSLVPGAPPLTVPANAPPAGQTPTKPNGG